MLGRVGIVAKSKSSKKGRISLPMRLLLIVLVAGTVGWRAAALHTQVQTAQQETQQLATAVEELRQENEVLLRDLEAGITQEKLEEIARDQLKLVSPGEYVFYDVSN